MGYAQFATPVSVGHFSYKYGVSVAVRLSDAIVDEISERPTHTYYHHYRTVNNLIDLITLRGSLYIEDCGYRAFAVPASQSINEEGPGKDGKKEYKEYRGIFPHKTAAVLAGLGWIGKSGLFISNRFGPRVRLGTILTDAQLPALPQAGDNCGNCVECVKACPAGALKGNSWYQGIDRDLIVDAKRCSDHMKSAYRNIGRGHVCGICIKVCPHGSGWRYGL